MIFFGMILLKRKNSRLVKWEDVYKPIAHGELGILSIVKMNKSLLGKWLWRMDNSVQRLWRQIIVDKYKVGREGWSVPDLNHKASSF